MSDTKLSLPVRTAPPPAAAPEPPAGSHDGPPEGYPLSAIEEALRSIRFGTVQIVIQDGRIVQIEKTEKIRLR